jgi:hypothetical protein
LLRELIVGLVEQGDDGAPSITKHWWAGAAGAQAGPALTAEDPLPDDSDRRLMNLCQAVMAAPSLDIAFEQHAENAGASVRTTARLFKDGLGMGFAEWRRQVQLATAVAELIQGCRSVPSPVNWVIRPAASATCSVGNWVSRRRSFRPVSIRADVFRARVWPKFRSTWPVLVGTAH